MTALESMFDGYEQQEIEKIIDSLDPDNTMTDKERGLIIGYMLGQWGVLAGVIVQENEDATELDLDFEFQKFLLQVKEMMIN